MKKMISMFLALVLAFSGTISAFAWDELKITSHDDWETVCKSDVAKLRWDEVTGAEGYRVTVKNDNTGDYLTQNEWTTNTSYDLQRLFDRKLGDDYPRLKVWVGAMYSEYDEGISAFTSDIIYLTVSDPPAVSGLKVSNIGENEATFSFSLDRDFGVPIEESGFLLGISSKVNKMDYYTVAKGTTKGVKEITVSGLEADTIYYVRGYSCNAAGETVTDAIPFITSSAKESSAVSGNSSKNEGFDWIEKELSLSDDYPEDEPVYEEQEPEQNFSVSKNSVRLGWGAGNEELIGVTGSDWKIEEIKYDVPNTAVKAGYDYKWLVAEQYGSELSVRPTRANYSTNERNAVIVLSCEGKTEKITVNQEACGEPKPTMSMMFGNKLLKSGDKITLEEGQKLDIEMSSTKIRRVFAQLIKNGTVIDDCSDLNNITFDSLAVGNYTIKIWASNSSTTNDFYSQSPFENGSMTLNVTITAKAKTSEEKEEKPVTVLGNTENFVGSILEDKVIEVAESKLGKNRKDFDWNDEYCGFFVGWAGRTAGANFPEKNWQCANGRVLTAWFVNNNAGSFYYFRDENYESLRTNEEISDSGIELCIKSSRDKFVPRKGDIIIFLWSSAPSTANWSHVGLVKDYDPTTQTIYTVEGNTTKDLIVANRTRYYGSEVVAFIRPDYAGELKNPEPSVEFHEEIEIEEEAFIGPKEPTNTEPTEAAQSNENEGGFFSDMWEWFINIFNFR